MKFEFCGNMACPQWFIAEISVLTKITAVKMKLIFNQLILHYLQALSPSSPASNELASKITKLLNNTGLDIYQINAVVSTLNFILHNSIRFHVTDIILNKQLIDLGLPKENVESIAKSYKSNRQKLLDKAVENMYRGNNTATIQYSIHEFLGSQRLGSKSLLPIKFAEIQINYNRSHQKQLQHTDKTRKNFIICEEQLDQLIFELEQAINIQEKLESEK